jgi:hypothetical protein
MPTCTKPGLPIDSTPSAYSLIRRSELGDNTGLQWHGDGLMLSTYNIGVGAEGMSSFERDVRNANERRRIGRVDDQ